MKIIIGDQASGKTVQLINEASKTGSTIICANPKSVLRLASEMQLNVKAISYEQYENSDKHKSYLIDDIINFFKMLMPSIIGLSFDTTGYKSSTVYNLANPMMHVDILSDD